jgi:hypothetical protein
MKNPDYEYVDLAIGDVSKRNNIIKVADVPGQIEKPIVAYATWHRFQKLFKLHVSTNHTVDLVGLPVPIIYHSISMIKICLKL